MRFFLLFVLISLLLFPLQAEAAAFQDLDELEQVACKILMDDPAGIYDYMNEDFLVKSRISENTIKHYKGKITLEQAYQNMRNMMLVQYQTADPEFALKLLVNDIWLNNSCENFRYYPMECRALYKTISEEKNALEAAPTADEIAAYASSIGVDECGHVFLDIVDEDFLYINQWRFEVIHTDSGWNLSNSIFVWGGFENYFESCEHQLKTIRHGLQELLKSGSTLDDFESLDEICHHALVIHDNPETCQSLLSDRTDRACESDTFEMAYFDDSDNFELTAISRGEKNCCLCATEKELTPKQDECKSEGPCACVHGDKEPEEKVVHKLTASDAPLVSISVQYGEKTLENLSDNSCSPEFVSRQMKQSNAYLMAIAMPPASMKEIDMPDDFYDLLVENATFEKDTIASWGWTFTNCDSAYELVNCEEEYERMASILMPNMEPGYFADLSKSAGVEECGIVYDKSIKADKEARQIYFLAGKISGKWVLLTPVAEPKTTQLNIPSMY